MSLRLFAFFTMLIAYAIMLGHSIFPHHHHHVQTNHVAHEHHHTHEGLHEEHSHDKDLFSHLFHSDDELTYLISAIDPIKAWCKDIPYSLPCTNRQFYFFDLEFSKGKAPPENAIPIRPQSSSKGLRAPPSFA
ncbi:MAG: hypothetical protein DWQ44_04340 [Bacteroidetes bacterium]|nr:MAG: hypothetical protein DWQ33_11450 [Bacteroidota bacterium]REK00698.1 MAG: hypothetical protein DWQ39_11125 [Bacteroidota bacterium]REK35180.1 MAG: hypothetical protein DWQ44_04340 [Bacteroidota bacterium]REK48257.1 MAG: hypothetical protein DWQ48_10540 [Bacteroidota bacterium]